MKERGDFSIEYTDEPDTVCGYGKLFQEKRGFDASWLAGCDFVGEVICAEDDLNDIKSGEYTPEDPKYETYCEGIVRSYKEWLRELITDDKAFNEAMNSKISGQRLMKTGQMSVKQPEMVKQIRTYPN